MLQTALVVYYQVGKYMAGLNHCLGMEFGLSTAREFGRNVILQPQLAIVRRETAIYT